MQLAAWNFGVVSRICTNMNMEPFLKDFEIPAELKPTAVLAFGYPVRKISGKKKNRKPITEIAFLGKYGNPLMPESLDIQQSQKSFHL
jgi:nitroreductase